MGRLWNMSGAQTHCKVTTPLGRTLAYLLAAQRETVSPFLPRSSNRLLDRLGVQPTLMVYTMAYTDG